MLIPSSHDHHHLAGPPRRHRNPSLHRTHGLRSAPGAPSTAGRRKARGDVRRTGLGEAAEPGCLDVQRPMFWHRTRYRAPMRFTPTCRRRNRSISIFDLQCRRCLRQGLGQGSAGRVGLSRSGGAQQVGWGSAGRVGLSRSGGAQQVGMRLRC